MKRLTILLCTMCFISLTVSALDVPKLKGRVNDYAGLLSSKEVSDLGSKLKSYERSSSTQMALLVIDSLEGDNLESFSIRVTDKWQLGTKNNDNGILLLIALDDRKIRLEVGYGLEGSLTDAKADYIIRNVISPDFGSGKYYNGLNEGFDAISGVISGEYQITPQKVSSSSRKEKSKGIPYSFIFAILFIVLSNMGRRGGRRGGGFGTFLIISSLLGGSSRSSGGFSSGGGGFSGGGGGFGGGGSSGGW